MHPAHPAAAGPVQPPGGTVVVLVMTRPAPQRPRLTAPDAVRRRAARDLLMFNDDRLTGVTRILMKSGREQIAACGHLTQEVLDSGEEDGFAEGWLAVHGPRLLAAAHLVRPAAIAQVMAGVPKIRVAAAAGIARGTLDRWLDAPGEPIEQCLRPVDEDL